MRTAVLTLHPCGLVPLLQEPGFVHHQYAVSVAQVLHNGRRVFKTWDDEVFNDYIEGGTRLLDDGRAELKCPTDVEAIFYDARAALDPDQYVSRLAGQYLLLVGGYEGAQSEQDDAVQRLFDESKGSTFKQLDRGSHFVPMEYPDLVLSEIREYFEGTPVG